MDLLATLRSVLPTDYLSSLLANPDDAGLIDGIVAVLTGAGSAVERLEAALHILDAPVGSKASTTLRFTPTNNPVSTVVVKAGSLFGDVALRRLFVLTEDVTVGPGATPGDGTALSVGTSAEYNVDGEFTSARGETIPGTIVASARVVTDPPYGCELDVRQMTDATGGDTPALETQAYEVGITRLDGEDEDTFRTRAWEQPDTVSPNAIMRVLHKQLAPVNVRSKLTEGVDIPGVVLSRDHFFYPDSAEGLSDALSGTAPVGGGLHSSNKAWFHVDAAATHPIENVSLVLSDDATTESMCLYPMGRRGVCALSLTGSSAGVLSGHDVGLTTLYAALREMLHSARAGGVLVTFAGR